FGQFSTIAIEGVASLPIEPPPVDERGTGGKAMAITKAVLSMFGLLLLAACDDNGLFPAPTTRSIGVPMDAEAWAILYSPGMPRHPTPQTGGGWSFDFPIAPGSVHY